MPHFMFFSKMHCVQSCKGLLPLHLSKRALQEAWRLLALLSLEVHTLRLDGSITWLYRLQRLAIKLRRRRSFIGHICNGGCCRGWPRGLRCWSLGLRCHARVLLRKVLEYCKSISCLGVAASGSNLKGRPLSSFATEAQGWPKSAYPARRCCTPQHCKRLTLYLGLRSPSGLSLSFNNTGLLVETLCDP